MRDVILIVTPVRNGAEYLDETIQSIVRQRGDFEIHYHVQDGGSTDATLDILRGWADRLRDAPDGCLPGCARVEMSWASATDHSMYDAIHAGFDSLFRKLGPLSDRRVAMTWINSDDIFTAGAFRTAMSYLFSNVGQPWLTGIPSIILSDGTIADVRDPPYTFCRRHLALGRYDGRSRPFLQQEGTFWTEAVWSKVGGLNRRLRLAGDWDLWRRMARHADLVTLRAVLAHHRRHPGQLSSAMDRYYAELDEVKRVEQPDVDVVPDEGDIGWAAGWNPALGRWATYQVNMGNAQEIYGGARHDVAPGLKLSFADPTWPVWVRDVSGVSGAEEWGRWSDAALAPSVRIRSIRPFPTNVTIRMRLAVLNATCSPVVVTVGSRRFELDALTDVSELSLHANLDAPTDVIDIRPSSSYCPKEQGWSDDARRIGIKLHTLEIVPGAAPASE